MTTGGKLIAIEGIDGSGKRTQVELLKDALGARGHQAFVTGFPIYDSWFGKMVGEFLDGEFGPLEEVDPHFTALLYAGDRLEAKGQIVEALAAGKIVLADRYIGSNMAHQTARVAAAERAETSVFFESPYRILKTLAACAELMPERQLCVARELTKKFEEFRRGTPSELLAHYEAHPAKGEITLVISGRNG